MIGWRALQLSEVHRRSVSVSEAAEGVLERLVAVTGETAHVAVARRSRVLYTRRFVARRRVSVAVPPTGLPLEMHCSAVGKVLLAARPVEQQTVLASRLSSYTPATITDPDVLRSRLREVGIAGYACDEGEMVDEVSCVAAPVRDGLGEVAAAIGISFPSVRSRQRQALAAEVVAAAAALSGQLRCSTAGPAGAGPPIVAHASRALGA